MSKNARAFRTTVGMSLQQFDFLMRDVEKAYPEAERKRLDRPGRKRGVGAGRPFALHLWGNGTLGSDVLPHLPDPGRHDPPVRHQPRVNLHQHRQNRPDHMGVPPRSAGRLREGQEVSHHRLNEFFPGLVALTDASEQPIQRPKRSDMEERTTPPRPRPTPSRYSTP